MKPVALITGAGRGIGRAAAMELSRLGHDLVLVSRTAAELKETARLCGGGLVIAGDVSDSKEVGKIIKRAMKEFGRVDVLVHCAGAALSRSIEQVTNEDWRAMVDTNLSAAVYLCRGLWPVWRKLGGGVVVNISSEAARNPFEGLGAYGAAKAGVNLLGLALAREGAGMNVRVHTIAPAATETKMLREVVSEKDLPTEKTMKPEDVARVVGQCVCGDLKYTSGEVIWMHKGV